VDRSMQALFESTPEPTWVQQMKDHHRRTGVFLPEDLFRLLGSPSKSVEMGPQACTSELRTQLR